MTKLWDNWFAAGVRDLVSFLLFSWLLWVMLALGLLAVLTHDNKFKDDCEAKRGVYYHIAGRRSDLCLDPKAVLDVDN